MKFHNDLTRGNSIGIGHFGEVFDGEDPVHGRVAIKILSQLSGESDSDWSDRSQEILSEAQKLKSAAHPNIVQVYNVAKDDLKDVTHMVIEFCDGGSLEDQYEAGPTSLKLVRNILTDVCRGLGHLHSCGMIHRDIKPPNILKSGNSYKIGDFGLVTNELTAGYASGNGYLDHLAPEFFFDDVTSVKTDIWALGMTTYRLLNGDKFYKEKLADWDLEAAIRGGGFATKLPWICHIPDEWRRFVRKAMHDDSSKRFQSAHDMGQALAHLRIVPNWECSFSTERIIWTRQTSKREEIVDLYRSEGNKFEWLNTLKGGGKRDLNRSGRKGRPTTLKQCENELRQFFSARK